MHKKNTSIRTIGLTYQLVLMCSSNIIYIIVKISLLVDMHKITRGHKYGTYLLKQKIKRLKPFNPPSQKTE